MKYITTTRKIISTLRLDIYNYKKERSNAGKSMCKLNAIEF